MFAGIGVLANTTVVSAAVVMGETKGAGVVVGDGATTTCSSTLALCSTSSAGRPTRLMPVLRFSDVISLDTAKPWLMF